MLIVAYNDYCSWVHLITLPLNIRLRFLSFSSWTSVTRFELSTLESRVDCSTNYADITGQRQTRLRIISGINTLAYFVRSSMPKHLEVCSQLFSFFCFENSSKNFSKFQKFWTFQICVIFYLASELLSYWHFWHF